MANDWTVGNERNPLLSWKHNKASPEEHPLHYIGKRLLHKVMTNEHLVKIIRRFDPDLPGTIGMVADLHCHVWSSNTFTVVFLETGHMGVSKRNAVDEADLNRGVRIAASRALAGFMTTWLQEEKDRHGGLKPSDLRNQIIPMARKNVPPLLEKIQMEEDRAREALIRRDERHISQSTGTRFRY